MDHLRSVVWDHPGQHGETLSLRKIQKISWAWWRVPVIPATREAEAGELPELRRQRLTVSGDRAIDSSLGNKSETRLKKKSKPQGWARWVNPAIPGLWEARREDHKVKSSRPAWPIW